MKVLKSFSRQREQRVTVQSEAEGQSVVGTGVSGRRDGRRDRVRVRLSRDRLTES